MSLRKEIEKSLRKESNEVDAVEDEGMTDSVLAIASSDFKENDVLDLPLTARKRSEVEIGVDYPGKPVSRKKYGKDVGAFDSDDGGSTDSSSGLKDGMMGLDDDGEESDDSDLAEDDEEQSDDNDLAGLEAEEEDEFDEDGEDGSDLEEEEEEGSEGSDVSGSDGEEKSPLTVFRSTTAASEEIRKGQAVKEQLRLWESLLECRIKLEPALVAANQLYQLDQMTAFMNRLKSSNAPECDAVRNSLQELSTSLRKLQTLLGEESQEKGSKNSSTEGEDDESIHSSEASGVSDNEESMEGHKEAPSRKHSKDEEEDEEEEINGPPSKKRKTSLERGLEEMYAAFASYRDAEIDKWNEKAKVSSGRAAQKDFSAFDQSILKLIESVLFDKYRLVRKTQQKRGDYVIYGKPKMAAESPVDKDVEGESKEDGALVTNDKLKNKVDVVYDAEIFDDGDFYQKLLRDFIEAKSADGGLSKHERKLMELHRLRIKMKRKVDTRATKGRKLRYVVHPKLVNFMAPVVLNAFSAEAEEQLLKSLFGQTVTS